MINLIESIDLIRSKITNWQVSDIAYIKTISLIPSDDSSRFLLDITFLSQDRQSSSNWPDTNGVFNEISLLFYDVSNLNFKFEGKFVPQLTGFEIVDISEQGWEGINFQIIDYENDVIEFYCRNIKVKSVEQSEKLQW